MGTSLLFVLLFVEITSQTSSSSCNIMTDAAESNAPLIEYRLTADVADGDERSSGDRILRYSAYQHRGAPEQQQQPLTVDQWIEHMTGDHSNECALQLTDLINESNFKGLRFETKGVSAESSKTVPFEFVLVRDDGLHGFAEYADKHTFADQLSVSLPDNPHGGTFANLGGDATLVCPKNEGDGDKNRYGHLAAFLRKAPVSQIQGLWKLVAETYRKELDSRSPDPVWLSTAGGGVRWLHFRLGRRPKYYWYEPFRKEF